MASLYLVTGSAGFIGFHLSRKIIAMGHRVIGVDNLNDYYAPQLKEDRNAILMKEAGYRFLKGDIQDKDFLVKLFQENDFKAVFHLAAQAGVRYSLERPEAYIDANVTGTLNVLEAARFASRKPALLIASSSSVYGLSTRLPFREDDPVDRPAALYGVTKRADELMAHAYTHLFGLQTTLLRFFTVYGPWGRPDMALFKFTKAIHEGRPVELYNRGDMVRDFTFIDDIVQGIWALHEARETGKLGPYEIFNIGCGKPRPLMDFVRVIESELRKKAEFEELPFQNGDVHQTAADTTKLARATGYVPQVGLEEGIGQYVRWFLEYYGAQR